MKSTLLLLKAICCLLFTTVFIEKSFGQAGTLDASFGDGGKVIAKFTNYEDYGSCITVQPDGKILVGGTIDNGVVSRNDFAVSRYLTNGSRDSSFGINGKVIIDISNSSSDYCRAIALQADGKIILAGRADLLLVIARLKKNGSLDSSFGENGLVLKSTIGYNNTTSVIIQADQKIVTGGLEKSSKYPSYQFISVLRRYNSNGSVDSSFGDNGKVENVFKSLHTSTYSVIKQNDGKILSGGYTGIKGKDSVIRNYILLARYNSNGSIDSSFGINGKDTININSPYDYGLSLAMQKDQKIIVSGSSNVGANDAFALLRYDIYGKLDSTFGTNGITLTKIFNSSQSSIGFDNALGVAVEDNGKIIQAGNTSNGNNLDFAVVKYNSDGFVDSTFGNNGVAISDFNKSDDPCEGLTLQQDSKILVVGFTYVGTNDADIAIARYNNTDVLPVTLLSFSVTKQQQTVLLNWQTANEINNNYFSVERSNNNKNFIELNKVYSINNSSKINIYNTTDAKPLQGWNYYKLKQIDNDGKFTYSSVASVFFDGVVTITVRPNPANNFIYVDGLKEDTQSNIFINDINGKTLVSMKTNQSSAKINIQNLASGIYYINVIQSGNTIKQNFLKQ